MAQSFHVSPPDPFVFTKPNEWPKWIRRFERFRLASALNEKSEAMQVNALVYAMGDEADDIMAGFGLTAEERERYEVVKSKFDSHFIVRRNTIFERAKFNRRCQEEGEMVDAFITALFCLAEFCDYGQLNDEMIRDRIVVGIRDTTLSLKLQLDAELTLKRAIDMARQNEAAKREQAMLRNFASSSTRTSVDFVKSKKKVSGGTRQKTNRPQGGQTQATTTKTSRKCEFCGRSSHQRAVCPAREATCFRCHRSGHFSTVCRSSKAVDTVSRDDEEGYSFLGEVTKGDQPWSSTISLEVMKTKQRVDVCFKLDTGADVTVISAADYRRAGSPSLEMTSKTLVGANDMVLKAQGKFVGKLSRDGSVVDEDVYVISGQRRSLLSRRVCQMLDLVRRVAVDSVEAADVIRQDNPKLFVGLGRMRGDYNIQLREGAVPFALSTPRRVSIPLLETVRQELQRMEDTGVIRRVEAPTDWCAGMVVVAKPKATTTSSDGVVTHKVRICVDLTHLNESVRREKHDLPSVDQTLGRLARAKVFTKLDANSGFWQIPLSPNCQELTTFITPFGRYCFRRLPFGITSAPEHFQKRMSAVLDGLSGVLCMMDDIVIFGASSKEHDTRVRAVFKRLADNGVTLNFAKCEFSKSSITYLGHVVTAEGIKADPAKVKAITEMGQPTDVGHIRRFLGMANQLGKFSPTLSSVTQPLRDLLQKDRQWFWGPSQQTAFDAVKAELSATPVLALYDPNRTTTVSADASSFGLGAVLLQRIDGTNRPVAYASRAMTPTEQRYSQIDKEALATTWSLERFHDYLYGMEFHVETDHKPLVTLLSSKKNLDELTPRIQRYRMRLMRYTYTIEHVPGKELITADALSRAPHVRELTISELQFADEVAAHEDFVVGQIPATERRLQEIKEQQQRDEICSQVLRYCAEGWPSHCSLPSILRPYWQCQQELTVHNGILLKGVRLVIPVSMRLEMIDRLHEGHQGVVKCRARAQASVWWPGLSRQLEEVVKNCTTCARERRNPSEPMIASECHLRPWQKVGTDMFFFRRSTYLLVVDYCSSYVEVARLETTDSSSVILHLKSIFARHGIPETVISDNGPQYSSFEFAQFARAQGFEHITSSPRFPQSNGKSERAVQTVKNLLKKAVDPYDALLAYRSTALECGYSPAELSMGRQLRTLVPTVPATLLPRWDEPRGERERRELMRQKKKDAYDRYHRARPLSTLRAGDPVWVEDANVNGTVVGPAHTPRSYVVRTPTSCLRRNRRHLQPTPNVTADERADDADPSSTEMTTTPVALRMREPRPVSPPAVTAPTGVVTRSGRVVIPPRRLDL